MAPMAGWFLLFAEPKAYIKTCKKIVTLVLQKKSCDFHRLCEMCQRMFCQYYAYRDIKEGGSVITLDPVAGAIY